MTGLLGLILSFILLKTKHFSPPTTKYDIIIDFPLFVVVEYVALKNAFKIPFFLRRALIGLSHEK